MSDHYQLITVIPKLKDMSAGLIMNLSSDSDDVQYVSFTNDSFPLPSNVQTADIKTLSDLINYVGSSYVSTTYMVGFKGTLNPSMCASGCRAYVNVASVTSRSPSISDFSQIYSSANNITENSPVYTEMPMDYDPDTITQLWQNTSFSGDTKCFSCDNSTLYSNASLWMKINVYVNMYDWCTVMGSDNIANNFCYNFIGKYCSSSSLGCDAKISTYLQDYCSRTYPYPSNKLDIFNDPDKLGNDYNICACNMDPLNYTEYGNSLQNNSDPPVAVAVPAQCVFPACKMSNFIPNSLGGCPGPTCVNAIVLSGNNIEGDPDFEQNNEDCYQYVTDTGNPPSDPDQASTDSQPFWTKWWFILIIIILLAFLIIAVIGGIAYYINNKPTSKY